MKTVLVTGALGFCGSHLCRYLIEKGYRVTGTFLHSRPTKKIPRLSLVRLDITRFFEVLALLEKIRPDFICHLAAMSVPRLSWALQDQTFKVNVGGTILLLEAVRRLNPKIKFLFASSIQVYGRTFRHGKSVKENDLLWPENPYAVSKVLAEYACLHYYHQFGVAAVIARAFNHLGRGQSLHFVFSDWCRQIALAERGRQRPVLQVGNLDARRDFLHVQDVVEAYEILLCRGKPGSIYNICQGRTRILQDYVDFLLGRSTRKMKIEVQTKRLRRYDPPVMKGDAHRLRALGWQPRRSPFEALAELLQEWRSKV